MRENIGFITKQLKVETHLHPENINIILSPHGAQDNTQNEIFVFKVGGLDSLRGYIAGNRKCAKTDK